MDPTTDPHDDPYPEIRRVRHELKLRELEVVDVRRVSPHLAAVTVRGDALADFASLSFDDHVKLFFDGGDGAEPVRRDYTPRRFDREARTLTLEFALHGDDAGNDAGDDGKDGADEGAASRWARNAAAGQRLTVGGPRGSMILPMDVDWHLLAGDLTALPAIARRLEELPDGARATVLVRAEPADWRDLPTRARADVRWVDADDALIDAVVAWTRPDGVGFAWGGGEAALMARLRRALADKGLPRQLTRVSAYWKRGVADHHERLE
jgi:NADPH-dependent ferric siderophore reductase